jgi:hypothetical protein
MVNDARSVQEVFRGSKSDVLPLPAWAKPNLANSRQIT